jgi:CBS domain containing-hemolysin-like protein
MFRLALAIALTLGLSFACSLMEAVILSTTVPELEAFKRRHPKRGKLLEQLKQSLDETISTVLALNTIATTLGAMIIGAIAAHLFGDTAVGIISGTLTLAVLILSEVIPKNLGVVHRTSLQPHVVYPLIWTRRVLFPLIWLCKQAVRFAVRGKPVASPSDQDIILLAEKGAQEGTLSHSESNIIANALSLDNVRVSEIMTPRTVVTALRKPATVGEVFREYPNIPFARIPVYQKNLDDVVGLVRRRDLLKAKANDQDPETVGNLMQEISFIPETATVGNALQVFLKTHQQLLVVVDEFGSTAGVVTMEDVMEQILGREIFEKDDMAVDMREFARAKLQRQSRGRRPGDPGGTAWPPTKGS